MCGRFSLNVSHNQVRQSAYDEDIEDWIDEEEYIPRYNIAPRTRAPVIRRRDADSGRSESNAAQNSSQSSLILQTMKWGLVPHWSKFEDKTLSTTNARSENLIEGGGMWASIKGKNRCAIPVQGYYEWLTKGKEKLPHFIKRKDEKIMLLAGLYDCVVLEGKPLWTFTIVTTNANKDFSWLHDRQPVILSNSESLRKWLHTSSHTWTPELTKLVKPYSDDSVPLECYQVPKEVGKVGTESPTFIEPVSNRKDGIQAMFAKQMESQYPGSPKKSQGELRRKRSTTPSSASGGSEQEGSSSPAKRTKLGVNPEDVGDSNQPLGTSPAKQIESKNKDVVKSPTKRKAQKKGIESSTNASKITSFFGKA